MNAVLVTSVPAETLSFGTKAPKGETVFYVVAFDGSGNLSGPSNIVIVTS
jgi:hypothetical protein